MSGKIRELMDMASRRAWLFAIVAIAASALVLFLAIANMRNIGNEMWKEAAKGSLNLVTGIILGGFLKLLLDAHSKMDETRTRRSDFRLSIISKLESIIDRMETARLLINAHKSAKTYGEQLRELLGVRVAVLDLLRSIEAVKAEMDDADEIMSNIKRMEGYLDELGEEYREKYKVVSNRQRYDEELTKIRMKHSAEAEKDGPPAAEDKAWKMLEDQMMFPKLSGFLVGDEYHGQVVYACTRAVALVRGKLLDVQVRPQG